MKALDRKHQIEALGYYAEGSRCSRMEILASNPPHTHYELRSTKTILKFSKVYRPLVAAVLLVVGVLLVANVQH